MTYHVMLALHCSCQGSHWPLSLPTGFSSQSTECTTSAALVSFACSADSDLMWPRKASALWHVAFFPAFGAASDSIHDAICLPCDETTDL